MGLKGAGALLRRQSRRVAVLGAGPSGLLAAQAAHERGYDPIIFSRPPLGDRAGSVAKSQLHGCQYLHAPVPSLSFAGGAGQPVDYTLRGTSQGYREKVYGPDSRVEVSPDEYGNAIPHLAWDLRLVYEKLWHQWLPAMRPLNVTHEEVVISLERGAWAKVFSTLPAHTICGDPTHTFTEQVVWAMGQREGTQDFPFSCSPFTVLCNGERDTGWYRIANVFGMTTVEWATTRKPPIKGVVQVAKPLQTNCTCHQDKGLVRLGRYGKWQKGVLVHTAYTEAKACLP